MDLEHLPSEKFATNELFIPKAIKTKIDEECIIMKDKVIAQSEQYNVKKYRNIICIVSVALIIAGIICYATNFQGCRIHYDNLLKKYLSYSIWENMLYFNDWLSGLLIDIGIILLVITVILGWWLSSYQLVITEKRIYGVTSWGKRVDLPVDSVSAVSSSSMKGIAVATSSGRIVFKCIKNRDELYETINKLLVNRQVTGDIKEDSGAGADALEELSKLKKLLDEEVITQEDFEKKKKQLLGL